MNLRSDERERFVLTFVSCTNCEKADRMNINSFLAYLYFSNQSSFSMLTATNVSFNSQITILTQINQQRKRKENINERSHKIIIFFYNEFDPHSIFSNIASFIPSRSFNRILRGIWILISMIFLRLFMNWRAISIIITTSFNVIYSSLSITCGSSCPVFFFEKAIILRSRIPEFHWRQPNNVTIMIFIRHIRLNQNIWFAG